MEYISKNKIVEMMLLSHKRIEEQKEQINKINVFPVPDQDTGSNIANTLQGINKALYGRFFSSNEELKRTIIDAVMSSAQGNSGIIYAGFLLGMGEVLGEEKLTLQRLSDGFVRGAQKAREAISDPKEGTMLDVIDASAAAIREKSEEGSGLASAFAFVVDRAKTALMETQHKMPVLSKANVVDAGGMAFLVIMESYYEALSGEIMIETGFDCASQEVKTFIQMVAEKYEIVAILENLKCQKKDIAAQLSRLGSSVDCIENEGRIKIHVHTNDPSAVKDALFACGTVAELREEDILKEAQGQKSLKKNLVGIVSDGGCELTDKILERYSISIVPMKSEWPLGAILKGRNVYEKLENAAKAEITDWPKTSQPSPKIFYEEFSEQLKKFSDVVCIPISSKLSGTYNSAIQGREMLPQQDKGRVFVVDSLQASASQDLMVLKAVELAQAKFGAQEIVAKLEEYKKNVRLYGVPEDFRWLYAGGRLSAKQYQLIRKMKWFGVIPILGLQDGLIVRKAISFGTRDIAEIISKKIKEDYRESIRQKKKIRIVITHCANREIAENLRLKLKEIKPEVSFVNLTSPIIGLHVGPKAVIVACVPLE